MRDRRERLGWMEGPGVRDGAGDGDDAEGEFGMGGETGRTQRR